MKRKLLVAIVACLAMMSIALFGCSGDGGSKADYDKNFAGSWTVVSMTTEGTTMNEDDMASLRSAGYKVELILNDDKTAKMTFTGDEDSTGKWEAKSATEMSLTLDGETATVKLADGKLSYDSDDVSMTFAKTDSLPAAAPSGSEGAANGAVANGDKESADVNKNFGDDNCTITMTRKAIDIAGDPSIYFTVENKLDKDIYLTITDGSASINGKAYETTMATTVSAGAKVTDEDFLWFKDATSDIKTLNDFSNIKFTVEVWDDATLDTLGTFEVSIA